MAWPCIGRDISAGASYSCRAASEPASYVTLQLVHLLQACYAYCSLYAYSIHTTPVGVRCVCVSCVVCGTRVLSTTAVVARALAAVGCERAEAGTECICHLVQLDYNCRIEIYTSYYSNPTVHTVYKQVQASCSSIIEYVRLKLTVQYIPCVLCNSLLCSLEHGTDSLESFYSCTVFLLGRTHSTVTLYSCELEYCKPVSLTGPLCAERAHAMCCLRSVPRHGCAPCMARPTTRPSPEPTRVHARITVRATANANAAHADSLIGHPHGTCSACH